MVAQLGDDLPVDELARRDVLLSEALSILLDAGSLSRLVSVLVQLGYSGVARDVLSLQASVLSVLTTSPRKSRKG